MAPAPRSEIHDQLRAVRKEVNALNKREQSLLKKLRKVHRLRSSLSQDLDSIEKNILHPPLLPCSTSNHPIVDPPRFLYISNGVWVCLLDLKHEEALHPLKTCVTVPPVPKIATLNLIENQLPLWAGLSKLGGSDVYLIGGEEFPAGRPKKPSVWISTLLFPKATSRAACCLSLSNNHTTLTLNPSIMMNSPKLWPVVEEIDGKIHVFSAAPSHMFQYSRDWMFSHEVLECGGDSWRTIPSPEKLYIRCHLLLGKRIFGVGQKRVVFDSEAEEWEIENAGVPKGSGLAPKYVWDILDYGAARCVGVVPGLLGEDPLYVVIGVVQHSYFSSQCHEVYVNSLAYLVTSAGKVEGIQRLNNFFEGAVVPLSCVKAKIIKEGDTVCSVVKANGQLSQTAVNQKSKTCENKTYDSTNYVFISTFTVEILVDGETWKGHQGDFVRLHTKKSYVYKNEFVQKYELNHFVAMEACLL